MLKNLIGLVEAGYQEEKDIGDIVIDAVGLTIILLIFCLIYAKQQEYIIKILIQISMLIQLESCFYHIEEINNYFIFLFILKMEEILRKDSKFYQAFTNALCLYIMIRFLAQFYDRFQTADLVLFVLWQPLNHMLLSSKKRKSANSPKQAPITQRLGSPQQHCSYAEQFQQNLMDDKILIPEEKINLTLNEELLNCLPYGLALIDSNFQVIKFNDKLLDYLFISESEHIVNQLDQLLQNAELNSFKTSPKTKKKPHIVPLRKLKQSSANYERSKMKGVQNNWISDRNNINLQIKESFNSSIQDATSYSYVQFVMNEFLTKSHRQINLCPDNQSFASDQTHMFKFHVVQERNIKKRHFQIKVYEVNLQRKTKDPVFLFIVENVTNKEELKELTFRFKFQQALLNSFSHELRTPLNCSLSLLQALTNKINVDLNSNYLQPAIVSCKRLLFQINDILDYAQIECKDFKLNMKPFTVNEIFENIKELFEQECTQKQIELIIDGNEQIEINNDKERVTQILVNLMNNSIKFTKQSGRIILSLKKRDTCFIFSVWDSGEGISSDVMVQMQEQSLLQQQANGANKLGLGLRVSKGIVKYLGGDGELSIKSEKGLWTLVSFQLEDAIDNPVKDEFVEDSKESAQRVYVSTKNFLKQCDCIQILIVDDVPFNHIALLALLQNFGYKAESAYDGDSAIRKVKQRLQGCCKSYKLIFMDIEMPGKNGFDTSCEISDILLRQGIQSIIIMCSAYNGQENAEQAHKCGMKEIITKPIRLDSLALILNKYFY